MIKPKKLRPGKVIYGKNLTFKGGSHSRTLSILPDENAKDIQSNLPEYQKVNQSLYEFFECIPRI